MAHSTDRYMHHLIDIIQLICVFDVLILWVLNMLKSTFSGGNIQNRVKNEDKIQSVYCDFKTSPIILPLLSHSVFSIIVDSVYYYCKNSANPKALK